MELKVLYDISFRELVIPKGSVVECVRNDIEKAIYFCIYKGRHVILKYPDCTIMVEDNEVYPRE